jgi:cytidine deaminase
MPSPAQLEKLKAAAKAAAGKAYAPYSKFKVGA